MGFKAPHSKIGGPAERHVDGDVDSHVEKEPAIPGVGGPGMKQYVEWTCRKVTNLNRPRVERTVNDEDDYGDENPEQIFMVTVITRREPGIRSCGRIRDAGICLRIVKNRLACSALRANAGSSAGTASAVPKAGRTS